MSNTLIRVVLALVWLVGGGVLLTRHWLLPPALFAGKPAYLLDGVGLLSVVLGGFRLFQVVMQVRRKRTPPPGPLNQPRPDMPAEYLPEFDFDKKEPPGDERSA